MFQAAGGTHLGSVALPGQRRTSHWQQRAGRGCEAQACMWVCFQQPHVALQNPLNAGHCTHELGIAVDNKLCRGGSWHMWR